MSDYESVDEKRVYFLLYQEKKFRHKWVKIVSQFVFRLPNGKFSIELPLKNNSIMF